MKDEERLEALRREIAALDDKLIDMLARRLELANRIGELKRGLGLPVMDPGREAEVVRRAADTARSRDLDPELVRDVFWRVIAQSRDVQEEDSDDD